MSSGSVQDFLSSNQSTIIYVILGIIVLYLLWGWYKGYSVNVAYDTTPRDQRMMQYGTQGSQAQYGTPNSM